MINESYVISHTNQIQFSVDKIRLRSAQDFVEELGPDGFTAVAINCDGEHEKPEVIGTASMKPWKDDGDWEPCDYGMELGSAFPGQASIPNFGGKQNLGENYYELCVVAISPDPRYRKKGIAKRLMKICEEEASRRQNRETKEQNAHIAVRVSKEHAGEYWLKQGFIPIGTRACARGFWESEEDFTMWIMLREPQAL